MLYMYTATYKTDLYTRIYIKFIHVYATLGGSGYNRKRPHMNTYINTYKCTQTPLET